VLEPKELRESVAAKLRAGAGRYGASQGRRKTGGNEG
jgi:hypothetical protein